MVLLVRGSTPAWAQSPCASTSIFNVTGGGAYCAGGVGVAIGLDGSQAGVSYQLQLDGGSIGSPVAGTGSAISFGNQTAAGAYTVVATADGTGCTTNESGSATMTVPLQPGPAQSSSTNGTFTLENNFLAVSWVTTNGTVLPMEFANKLATQSWTQAGCELFSLLYTSTGSDGMTSSVSLTASDCILVSGPRLQASQPNSQSTRVGDQLPGRELVASFLDPSSGIQVDWRGVLRDGANYVRQFLTIHGTNSSDKIGAVELLDYATVATPAQVGMVSGSPVVAGQAFFGGETPFAASILTSNRVRINVATALPLGPNITYDFSAVAGVFPVGQLRRSFLYYLERERAAPYWQLLQFNSWLDALFDVSEAEMLMAISGCELELHQRRGVALDSYAMDDGWYDPSLGFWAIGTNKFPHQFDLLQSNITAVGSHIGLWISPLGGYPPRQQELVQDAINEGIVTSNLDLSIPTYYTWWTNECATFILSNAMSYFKWDNAGNGVTPHLMALLRAADALRSWSTNLFINVTVGTWPSPFWLNHIDSTWRGGNDDGAAGVGDAREQMITYRDGQIWQNVVQAAPLYPLTSLMLGSVLPANHTGADLQACTNLQHDARSFFGSGINIQELCFTPSMLTSDNWNDVAEAAAWARTNASVLADSHWVGGNPNNLEVYGWAAWTAEKGTVVLRNPSSQTNCISFDIGEAFELPADAPTTYNLSPPYADQRPTVTRLQAGQPLFITLLPFEVLVFDALPAPDTPQPPTVTLQLPPPVRYCGATVSLQAAAEGTLPISFQWNFNGAPIAFATNATLLLDNLDYTAAGNYSVTVSNTFGVATSAAVALAVQTPGRFAVAILADHPVAWWRMDETIGPTVVDSWDSHNGTAFGNVGFGVPGAVANDTDTAIHFDGSSGTKIDVPYAPELNSASFSFECWARVTGGAGTYRSPLTSRDDSPTRGYVCYASSDDRWEFWTGTGASWDIISGPTVVTAQWTHLVGTYDGSNKSFYVNSDLVGATQPAYLRNADRPLRIGAGATEGDGADFFVGDVDEVAVYDYALSAAQVQAHYLASCPTSILTFNVTGGGAYCTNGIGVAIGLDGSQFRVNYQLQLNSVNTGSPVAGTGSAISFGDQTAAGTYTVVATFDDTGYTTNMSGSATVTAWPIIFNVTGGGAYCTNGIGVAIGLDGSQSRVNYQLQLNSVNTGSPVAGTGSAISFGNQTAAGAYTVVATVGSLGCATNMSGSATVTVSPLPAAVLEWQLQYFNCTNCALAQLNVDADGTGQNNFFKFTAGLDPTNPTSIFIISPASVQNLPGQFSFQFTPVVAGRTYTPQFCKDLLSGVWLPLTNYAGPVTNGAQVTVTDLSATNQRKFYRIDIRYVAPADSVGDGIPDYWRAQYFANQPTNNVNGTMTNSQSCASCDADGTGQNNLFKYVAGLDPTNPASVFILKIASVPGQPTQKNLMYQPIASGHTYVVQSVTDLVAGVWSVQATSAPLTNGTQVTVTDPYANTPGKFYRVDIYNILTNINIIVKDSVGDGIPDSWRAQYFANQPTNNVNGTMTNSQSCASCDADGTGQNNLFKYVAGLDPTNPASVFILKIASVPGQPSQKNLIFNPEVSGRTYTPQFRTNLVSGAWATLTGISAPVTNVSNNQVTVTDLSATTSKFYRIDISLP